MKNKVASNLEKTVENRQLQDLIQEIRVPTETVTEIKDNKKRDVERKIFPGYVLVKMVLTDESGMLCAISADVPDLSGRPPNRSRSPTKRWRGLEWRSARWKSTMT